MTVNVSNLLFSLIKDKLLFCCAFCCAILSKASFRAKATFFIHNNCFSLGVSKPLTPFPNMDLKAFSASSKVMLITLIRACVG